MHVNKPPERFDVGEQDNAYDITDPANWGTNDHELKDFWWKKVP